MQVVDGVQRMILHMPAECRHAGAHIQPWHHDSCDQLFSHQVPQHRPLHGKQELSANNIPLVGFSMLGWCHVSFLLLEHAQPDI